MGWWKADPVPTAPHPQKAPSATAVPTQPLPPQPSISTDFTQACPVDAKTREIWLQQAKAQNSRTETQPQRIDLRSQFLPSHPPLPQTQSLPSINTTDSSKECSSDRISQSPSRSEQQSVYAPSRRLSHDRVVSSIPRAPPQSPLTTSPPSHPANAETETGPHTSGNWIYPSESQFFHAVMKKSTLTASTPEDLASSISAIIPIHNAVNERAWHLIRQWEAPATATTTTKTCNGPKLLSFQGLGAGAKSPKARLMSLWGYTEPFDRHDWTVERCDGRKVEYLIDFYQGRAESASDGAGGGKGARTGANLNFYLDVRPKLNSLEGWRMRAEKIVGWR